MVLVCAPADKAKLSEPVVAVTLPLGFSCNVVDGLRLTSPEPDHEIVPPTLVKVEAHVGGDPDGTSVAIWYDVEFWVKAIVYAQPTMIAW
jgi:hypothetical protein